MEIEILSGLSEFGIRLARIILKYFNVISHLPYLQYVAFGFGSFLVFVKKHMPKIHRKITKKI